MLKGQFALTFEIGDSGYEPEINPIIIIKNLVNSS
jgi:hypothetical protein